MALIRNPIDNYVDKDGSPLSNGYLNFGEVNGNPLTEPVAVYYDAAFNQPAAQPVRTVNGYPVRNGSPTGIYALGDVSILVRNSKKEQVYYAKSSSVNDNTSYIERSSDTTLTIEDNSRTFIATGTFTQTFDAAFNLGDGWSITYANLGTGVITFDPNLSELIDGLITEPLLPNNMCIIRCDGVGFKTTFARIRDDSVIARTLGDSALGFSLINGYILVATPGIGVQALAVKTKAGNDPTPEDPVLVKFRGPSLTDGSYYIRSITSQLNLSISNGSTLGMQNGIAANIQLLLIDNAGSVELAVCNNFGALRLDGLSLISTTAEGGAGGADSVDVVYSNAARANVPYCPVGFFTTQQATAGSWVTPASQVQLYQTVPIKGGAWTYLPVYTTTGGINIDLPVGTTIPPWATDIEVIFELSTNGAIDMIGQIGDSGGIEITGYDSNCVQTAGGGNVISSSTAAFLISNSMLAADTYKGVWRLRKKDGNTWQSDSITKRAASSIITMSGDKTLSDVLTSLRITTATAVNTFDIVNVVARYR